MKKKISLLVAALSLLLILTSCVESKTTSALTLSSLEGAGTKTITFSIPKDAPTKTETKTNDDGSISTEYTIYNNSTYFPKGYGAFADWVIAQLPAEDGFRYEIDESDAENVLINFSYDFTSFEDYAKKTKDLMGEERWNASSFMNPQVVVTEIKDPSDSNYGKLRVKFVESNYMIS